MPQSYGRLMHLGIVIRNGKIIWKHEPYCWYYCWYILVWPSRAYIKTAKYGDFCEELLGENDFEVVLVTSCFYDHGAKVSEAVQKIATDQKDYCKCSSYVKICWILGYKDSSNVAKEAADVAQKNCIHNGRETTTWMGYSFKTKSTESIATFSR